MSDALPAPRFGRRPEVARERAGPRQPARRAHRLQRRLRPADRARAADDGLARPRRGGSEFTLRSDGFAEPLRFTLDRLPDEPFGALRVRLHPGGRAAAAMRFRRSTSTSAPSCRWASACRRAPRSRWRRCARLRRLLGAAVDDVEIAQHGAARRDRLRGRALRHHGPDGVEPGRHRARALPRHAHAGDAAVVAARRQRRAGARLRQCRARS